MSESSTTNQTSLENKRFWSEPCGSISFKKLGFKNSLEFDKWYFSFYPYLARHIPFDSVADKRILEIGLGMGTVAEKLASNCANYTGIDLAEGSVEIVKKRFEDSKISAEVLCADILTHPLEENSFDWVISIGCLHHTGNFKGAVDQVVRCLKPGGECLLMVYNAFSYRQWLLSPFATFGKLISRNYEYFPANSDKHNRRLYDPNTKGEAAPFTEFLSIGQINLILKSYNIHPSVRTENIGSIFMFPLPRNWKLKIFGSFLGLDLYIHFKKPIN